MAKYYRYYIALLFILALFPANSVPPDLKTLKTGYYIVVAAYFEHQEDYAKRFSEKINKEGAHSIYGLDKPRKYIYVYLDFFSDFKESVRHMLEIRKQGVFKDAWVRNIKAGDEPFVVTQVKDESVIVKSANENLKVIEIKKDTTTTKSETVSKKEKDTVVIDNPKPLPVYVPQTLNNTQVFLSVYNATNDRILDTDIEVIDTDRAKLITKVKSNNYLSLPDPKSKSGKLTLIANVFGYRKEQLEVNYKQTESDTLKPYVTIIGNYYMINFAMSRLVKGDIQTLFNVYFYNDAAIMLPESKYQLNALLQMLTENPKLKIILHGHTNGNNRGKIIYMGPSKDFFNITSDKIESSGSAVELSGARAEVIRQWLISQRVDGSRITSKAWGGKRMLHDRNSVHARKNIRVDVEVEEE